MNIFIDEEALRNLYLKGLAIGKIQGPPTGKPSIDKTWLSNYTDEQILVEMPKMSIYNYMMKNNLDHMDDVALEYFGKKITYKQFDDKINQFANSILKHGVKHGDVVTVCMPNTPEAVIAFYALNKIGVVVQMVHPLSSENEIKNFCNEVDSRFLITIDSSLDKVANIVSSTKLNDIVVVSPFDSMPVPKKIVSKISNLFSKKSKFKKCINWKDFVALGKLNSGDSISEYPYNGDKPAVILRTGGSTGEPKGVSLSNDNFNSMVEQFKQNADNFDRGDKMLTVMPVFHGFGLCSSIHLPLSLGVSSILIPKLNSKKIDKLFKKYKPNHILGVPTLFKAITNNKKMQKMKINYVKYVVFGGDMVKDSLEKAVRIFFEKKGSKVKCCKGYGLSEATAGITFACDNYNEFGSIGIPMVKSNIKIIDQKTNTEVEKENIGELCVKGPSVTSGYYNNEKATNLAIDEDKWLHTGDLGYYKDGLYYYSTRKGNMIISSGVNVYPNVIEQVIESHEAVSVCVVIGIKHPYKTEVPKAYIILKENYEYSPELEKSIMDLCSKSLNKYSVPNKIEFRETLPQTLLGKFNHRALKQQNLQLVKKQ